LDPPEVCAYGANKALPLYDMMQYDTVRVVADATVFQQRRLQSLLSLRCALCFFCDIHLI